MVEKKEVKVAKDGHIILDGKEYRLQYKMGNLRELKAECDITIQNLQEKYQKDLIETLINMVWYGIKPEIRKTLDKDKVAYDIPLSAQEIIDKAFELEMSSEQTQKVEEIMKSEAEKADKDGSSNKS